MSRSRSRRRHECWKAFYLHASSVSRATHQFVVVAHSLPAELDANLLSVRQTAGVLGHN